VKISPQFHARRSGVLRRTQVVDYSRFRVTVGLMLLAKDSPALGKHAEMFDPPKYNSDYESWLTAFTEASARLDALEAALIEVRQLLRYSERLHSEEIVKVLEQHGV